MAHELKVDGTKSGWAGSGGWSSLAGLVERLNRVASVMVEPELDAPDGGGMRCTSGPGGGSWTRQQLDNRLDHWGQSIYYIGREPIAELGYINLFTCLHKSIIIRFSCYLLISSLNFLFIFKLVKSW